MSISLQKANFWKRISAYLFDLILTVILAVGFATALSALFRYDSHTEKLDAYYIKYEQEYGVDFDITEEEFDKLSKEEQENFNAASEALGNDADVLKVYNTMFYLTLAIISISLLLAVLILYFIVPLFFHNGQTLGKKIFGLAVMRTSAVKISNFVLFARSILGLYTIETMFPVLLIVMIYFGALGSVGTLTVGLFLILQIAVLIMTKTNSSIHDLLSDTVVVDMGSQQIFESQEALEEYQKELARKEAEKAEQAENAQA